MGYKRPKRAYLLKFDDEPGLEVNAKSVPVAHLLGIMQLADKMTENPDPKTVRTLFGWFIRRVSDWNLEEEDGTPVPVVLAQCTESGLDIPEPGCCAEHAEREDSCPVAGLLAQDFDFALKLVLGWVQAVASVQVPSVAPAAQQATGAMEASIPMASASGM